MPDNEQVMLLGGDLQIQRPDPESMFAHIAPVLQESDFLFGNLEGVICEPMPTQAGHLVLRSDPEMLAAYKSAGFSVLGLGNHGITSCGTESLERCIEILDEAGIAHAGGGHKLSDARKPAIIDRGGTRVAFLAYSCLSEPRVFATAESPGVAGIRVGTSYEFPPHASPGGMPIVRTETNPEDLAAVKEDVQQAKAQADIVVATWHWGIGPMRAGALAGKVMDYQKELAHAAIDSGCDLVVGHHPHVLSGVEVYKAKAIFYSLGNFAFDYFASPERMATFYRGVARIRRNSFGMVRCLIKGKAIQEVSLLPLRIPDEDPRPVLLDTTQGRDIVELAQEMSEEFGTQLRPREKDILILEAQAPVSA
jgi:poly-gamma-glutamate capsule biosynthesis protein CapA/YwtB (metallophosphatase superfamily)